MQILIDSASNRPVYLQIIDQIKYDIALGRLIKGDKLPTVRQLAAQLIINPNTIAKAYRQLEHDGIIATKPGAGAFVARLDSNLSMSVREKIICRQIDHTIVDAVHMQIGKQSLNSWFDKALEKFKVDNTI